jgi:DNA helicase II / ATP-dependent DNA helicase PcrA
MTSDLGGASQEPVEHLTAPRGCASEAFGAELNVPQAAAVAATEGPLLVFAGAGSGKTRVITYRVAHLVATYDVAPYRILAVTFTNKAAGEMKQRLAKLLGDDVARDLWVGTFHATCARLLRRHAEAAGLKKDFLIYDEADQRAVVTRVLKELDLDDRRYPVRMLLSRIHKEKQEGRGPEQMPRRDFVDDQIAPVYERYDKKLAEANAVDFEDLILRVTRLAEGKTDAGDELRRRFAYVLVDEFQDTNHMQYRLVRQLAGQSRNLCVVGDDDQSIYRWRGADIRNIRGFRSDFPEADVVKLEQNYRSTARIVRAALAIIKPCREREPKELWTANEEGAKVAVVATTDERGEAGFLVSRVQALVAESVSLGDIAVFYRVHAQSRVLEEALRTENIAYQIIGGTKFFERAEIKDFLAYLRVLVNPRSDVDLLRVINVPARGIGRATIDRLIALADEHGASTFDALELASRASEIGTAARKRLAAFRAMLAGLADRVLTMAPSEAAALVLDQTGFEKALKAEDTAESDARLENLGELVGSIMDYEEEAKAAGETPTLAGYLERVTLSSDTDQLEDAPKLVLMTVHGAKGLEFKNVFLTGMEDELFPYRGLAPGEEEDLEEERRLAYVAVTRARERLFVTYAMVRTLFGQVRYGRPSRFLLNLPPEDVETLAEASSPTRFIDRPGWGGVARPSSRPQPAAPETPSPPAGGRFVDRAAFDDLTEEEHREMLQPGARVKHARFGEGEVKRVEHAAELMVVAHFPGWGEKKIVARFLSRP